MSDVLRLERLSVQRGKAIACRRISLSVPRGAVYVLLGRKGAGKSPLVACILGRERPAQGRALLFGEDSWRKRRSVRKRIALHPGELGGDRELLVLEEPRETPAVLAGATAFLAAASPGATESIATHVGILNRGRLVFDAAMHDIARHVRRIHYANRMTETRTAFGNELDEFHALSVKVRGWGIEAIVSDFDDAAFARFREIDGVEDAAAEPLTLDEMFQALG